MFPDNLPPNSSDLPPVPLETRVGKQEERKLRARKEGAALGKLEFEEEMEPAVTELGIGRD